MMMVGIGSVAVLQPSPAQAINVFNQCSANAQSSVCRSQGDNAQSMIRNVINIILFVLGMNGNASQTKEAKDTILYAIVGLVVAILSYTIVNFVLGRL